MKAVRRDPDKAYIDTWLSVPKSYVNVDAMKSALTYEKKDRYSEEEETLILWKETSTHMLVPRAFWDPTTLPFPTIDCRPLSYARVEITSTIHLDHRIKEVNGEKVLAPTGEDTQRKALAALQEAPGGTLQLSCGRGKTVIALEKIVRDGVPAIIVLDNTSLLGQWRGDIEEFLDVPDGVGLVASGKFDWKKPIVLATYQTLAARAHKFPPEFRRWFGNIFFDEGHHINAPTFSRCCDIFYGNRYQLTATPEREDGLHIIAQYHLGPVLYKDLRPLMTPRFIFKWTGLKLDTDDDSVNKAVVDVTGEIHNSKVTSYLAKHPAHLQIMFQDGIDAVTAGRKVLALTNSVAEAVNLMTLWTRGWGTPLYSDIPIPTASELNLDVEPELLADSRAKALKKKIESFWRTVSGGKRGTDRLEDEINKHMHAWDKHRAGMRVEAELKKRQRAFIRDLLQETSGAGLMTYEVPEEDRQKFLEKRPIIYAITKYGKEGLDCVSLDTVLVSSLFSSRPGLQQLMGRPTRPAPGKKTPTVVFYVHTIGQHIGMSRNLQKHLRSWPVDEGGPYEYELLHYPEVTACRLTSLKEAFGS